MPLVLCSAKAKNKTTHDTFSSSVAGESSYTIHTSSALACADFLFTSSSTVFSWIFHKKKIVNMQKNTPHPSKKRHKHTHYNSA